MVILEKKPLKTFGNADLRKFFARLASYHCSWVLKTVKILGFLEKEMDFFRKAVESFLKHSTWILWFRKRSKSFSGLCNLKKFKSWDFSEKSLKIFRSTMLGIFDLECVSEFQFVEEISKQSNFRVFRRNRCLWKDPRFFPKSVNVASFF